MAIKKISPDSNGRGRKVGIVLSRFNTSIGGPLLKGARAALSEAGVSESNVLIVTVPGALEAPLVLQKMAQSGRYDALIALGAVIRGETYHFEIVANESARGVARVALDAGVPVANAILTTDDEEQARARVEEKGRDAARVAVEMANLMWALGEDGEVDNDE